MEDSFITPAQVCELIPGMTPQRLAQMRFQGNSGLKFYKPTPKTVLYKYGEVISWIVSSGKLSTAD